MWFLGNNKLVNKLGCGCYIHARDGSPQPMRERLLMSQPGGYKRGCTRENNESESERERVWFSSPDLKDLLQQAQDLPIPGTLM